MMAKHLHKKPAALMALLALPALWGAAGSAYAQMDPTRPTAAWLAAQPPGPDGQVPGMDTGPAVRVVLISESRKLAVIDGHVVRQGATVNGSKLVGVGHDGVVLQRGGAKEQLSMAPGVEKKVKVEGSGNEKSRAGKKMANGEK